MRLIPSICSLTLAATLSAFSADSAVAGPFTNVVSAFDDDDKFDINMTLQYGLDIKSAAVKREFVGFPGTDPTAPVPRVKDLVYQNSRHTLTPRLEFGFFKDMSLSVALPLVMGDNRSLGLDQRDEPCIFPGGVEDPTCIDRTNSTTINDGLLPSEGYDANNPDAPNFADDTMMFRGPGRAGLDQIHLGFTWAAMNQQRDDTKPTWKLGTEVRLAVGKEMRLDVQSPNNDTGVGRGVHEIRVWTSMARRIGWAEPYIEMWWLAPFAETDASAFNDLGYGQERHQSQQSAGAYFGFEAIAYDQPEKKRRVSLNFAARLTGHFEGRAYSEMWEVFQMAGQADGDPLYLDSDPVTDGIQGLVNPGVSKIENHMSYGGVFGVRTELGDKVRIGASFEIRGTQGHVITFADAGEDLPTCDGTNADACEVDNNVLVNPGTEEVNPAHTDLVDLVGRRYYADDIVNYSVLLDARVLF